MAKGTTALSQVEERIKNMHPVRQDLLFIDVALLICLIKHLLICSLPLEVRDYNTDDRLMVEMAAGILNGQWLGPYDAVKLMKGAAFPVFLAVARTSGSSYMRLLDFTNSAACLFFTWQVRKIIKDRRLLFVLFTVLLFDPCTFSRFVFQRVYRSSITWPEVLFIIGAYLGLYNKMLEHREEGSWNRGLMRELLTAALGAATLAFMWNSREESFWMLPFALTASVLIFNVSAGAFRQGDTGIKRLLFCVFCLLLFPAAVLFGNAGVRILNQQYYGEAVRLEEIDGTFGAALKTIYSVRNRTELPYVSVSREKLERLYKVSPSLKSIQPELEETLAYYDAVDRGGEDGETEDGWFFWALRRAAFDAGKTDTLPHSQLFWKQMQEELLAALKNPDSGLEQQSVLPSTLLSPFRPAYLRKLPLTFAKAVCYMVSYQEVAPLWGASGKESKDSLELFQDVTGDRAAGNDSQSKLSLQAMWIDGILHVYRLLNPVVAVVSIICFLLLLVRSILVRSSEHIPCLLTVSGLLLTAAVLLMGVSYAEITAFSAISYFYLSGAYPLMLGGFWIMILYSVSCFNGATIKF